MIRTFAPSEMHWSACDFCFCGSPCAFTTRAATPAALNAFCSAGRSNCSQRTEVLVSGIRPQMVIPALFLLELALAEATTLIATTPTTPSSRTGDLRKTFVMRPLLLVGFRAPDRRHAPCSAVRPQRSRADAGPRCQNSRIRRPASSAGAFEFRVAPSGQALMGGFGLGLLPGVEQALRVERLLDRRVE